MITVHFRHEDGDAPFARRVVAVPRQGEVVTFVGKKGEKGPMYVVVNIAHVVSESEKRSRVHVVLRDAA